MVHHFQLADAVSRSYFHDRLSTNIHAEGLTSASFC